MIDFTIETEIHRPVAEVFAYISDPDKLPTWQTNTVSVEQHCNTLKRVLESRNGLQAG